jgi:hypothetical protein
MTDPHAIPEYLRSFLGQEGIDHDASVDVSGFHDQPGFHWSNPGIKLVTVTAGDDRKSYVVKRLAPHARREVLIYRALSDRPDFPMPRLLHSIYDEVAKEYSLILELGMSDPTVLGVAFWHQAGLLLARIHASYWESTEALPDVFRTERPREEAWIAVQDLLAYLRDLSPAEQAEISADGAQLAAQLACALAQVRAAALPAEPPPARCLVHAAFHPPEMVWRQTDAGCMPIAVDWEKACIGVPEDDFLVVASLTAEGNVDALRELRDSYFAEMRCLGISLVEDELWSACRQQALIHELRLIPWLLGQYLEHREDDAFTDWCRWARGVIPGALAYVRDSIADGTLYRNQ